MNLFEAVILGIIQGLTEFLPVSSSGHLQLLHALFGIDEPTLMFDVWLHVATLIPVFIVFRKTIWELIKNPFQKMTLLLIIGTIPAVIAALFFGEQIESLFEGGSIGFLAVTFAITGFLLLFADWAASRLGGKKTTEDMSWVDAAIIGVAQAFAIPPGISRSGTTLSTALGRKLNRDEAAKFIFLLSIPAILGATINEIMKIVRLPEDAYEPIFAFGLPAMIAGFIAAALAGYLAVQLMLALIRKAKLRYFSIYVFALAIFVAVDTFLLGGTILG
ncbi:MAG: undecaprenyl-diphosphate phosphatase [Defluviitaleaceae bacterium]|nr:undecaprenyl-diphosphate phosphatase [Defluviitaleaceae bacterium]